MTYCLAIKVKEGLVCLADGRITAGRQVTAARKVERMGPPDAGPRGELITMTSGLRSVRDKTMAFFRRELDGRGAEPFPSMLDAVDAYCAKLREVREQDEADLKNSNLKFNIHTILGGKMPEDREPSLFLVYPEGNWIEVGSRTPYLSIGETSYGKPILDRTLTPETDLATAMKLAYLSFDSTRISAADVGFPIDMLTYSAKEEIWREAHYEYDDLLQQRQWWNRQITELAVQMPAGPWEATLLPGTKAKSRLQVISGDEDV